MGYCMFCKRNVAGTATFCPACGAELAQIPGAAAQQPVQHQVAPVYVTQQVIVNDTKKKTGCGCGTLLAIIFVLWLIGTLTSHKDAPPPPTSSPIAQP